MMDLDYDRETSRQCAIDRANRRAIAGWERRYAEGPEEPREPEIVGVVAVVYDSMDAAQSAEAERVMVAIECVTGIDCVSTRSDLTDLLDPDLVCAVVEIAPIDEDCERCGELRAIRVRGDDYERIRDEAAEHAREYARRER